MPPPRAVARTLVGAAARGPRAVLLLAIGLSLTTARSAGHPRPGHHHPQPRYIMYYNQTMYGGPDGPAPPWARESAAGGERPFPAGPDTEHGLARSV